MLTNRVEASAKKSCLLIPVYQWRTNPCEPKKVLPACAAERAPLRRQLRVRLAHRARSAASCVLVAVLAA